MSRRAKIIGLFAALTLGIALLVIQIQTTDWKVFSQTLLGLGPWPFVIFPLISLANFALYVWRWRIILLVLNTGNVTLGFWRLFAHRLTGYAFGYITPAAQVAGEPVRVALLSKDDIKPDIATGSVVLDLAFETITFVVFVLTGVVWAIFTRREILSGFIAPIIFIFLLLAVLTIFLYATVGGHGFFRHIISRFERLYPKAKLTALIDWVKLTEDLMTAFFKAAPQKIIGVVALSFLMTGFKIIEVWYLLSLLGQLVSPTDLFFLSTLPGIFLLIPIPGGVGVFEGGNALIFGVLGLTASPLVYTFIIRFRDLVLITLGLIHGIREGIIYALRNRAKNP